MTVASIRSWLTSAIRRSRMEKDLDEELRFHVDAYAADLIRQGVERDEALRRARSEFGAIQARKDECREALGLRIVDELRQDLQFALRTMRRNPSFSAAVLLTLTLGIALTTVVFSVVDGVLLKPLPYPAGERLVRVWEEHPGGTPPTRDRWLNTGTYDVWSTHSRTVDFIGGVGTYDYDWEYTLQVGEGAVRVFGSEVAPRLFDALGPKPLVGRLFTENDPVKGNDAVVLLGEALWKDVFAGDPHVIGRPVIIDDVPRRVIGVIDGSFAFPSRRAQFWVPYVGSPGTAIARIARGTTLAQVEAEGTAVARSVPSSPRTELLFGKGGPPVVHAVPLDQDLTATVRPALRVLSIAVACVLLIACANVANLLLSRGVARERELTIRAAVGAGRTRLARQMFTEAAVFAVVGGAAGIAIAAGLIRLLPSIAPSRLPRLEDVHLDIRTLTAGLVAVILTTIVSGLAPVLRDGRFRVIGSWRLRDGLVVSEAAFTALLLVVAGLLVHSFVKLTLVDAGYTADHVLTVRAHLPPSVPAARTNQFAENALQKLRALPDVRAAGAGSMMPFFAFTQVTSFLLPPPAAGPPPVRTRQTTYTITPGYGEAIGLRLKDGRLFNEEDVKSNVRRMIVNEEFIHRYATGGSLVGRHLRRLFSNDDPSVDTEVIGVVENVLKDGSDRQPEPEVYFVRRASDPRPFRPLNLIIKSTDAPSMLGPAVRAILREADGEVIIDAIDPLDERVAASVAQPRFATMVIVAFASAAVVLAAVGLYGVLAFAVAERRRELGIRAALGSSRAALLGLVLRHGISMTLVGLMIGLAASIAVTRFMRAALFGVTPHDPLSLVAAPVILTAVAIAACLQPAIRAMSVDPAEVLRSE